MGHRLSKITTSTGDDGTTGLGDGSRVAKSSRRIEALGEVDELNAVLGLLASETADEDLRAVLAEIQHALFDLGGELCLPGAAVLGGDWVLEAATGSIETAALEAPAYEGILAPSNAGFESDFSGWVSSDAVIGTGAVYSAGSNQWTVNPYGSKMAVVQPAGASGELSGVYGALQVGSAAQTYLNSRFSNPTNFGYVYTDVTLAAGETFDMAWNYVATDYSPYNDASWVSVVNRSNASDTSMSIRPGAGSAFVGGQVSILGATVTGTGNYVTGNYGSTGWQTVTIVAGEAGTYRIGFAVFNLADTILSPYLFVDQAAGTTLKNGTPYGPVPAPAVLPPPPVAPNAAPVFSGTTYSSGSNTYTDTAGNDTFIVIGGQNMVVDSGGIDIVKSAVSFSLTYTADPAASWASGGIETLELTGAANIYGFGDINSNVIYGNNANNQLDGKGGNDTLDGRAGNDVLQIGSDSGGVSGATTLLGGADADLFWIGKGYLGDHSSGANQLTLGDFTSGVDHIRFGIDLAATAPTALGTTPVYAFDTLAMVLDRAAGGLGSPTNPTIKKFEFAGDTYLVLDQSTAIVFSASDLAIKITGTPGVVLSDLVFDLV